MNKIIGAILFIFIVAGCNHKNTATCYKGTIIMSSCCTGSTFIDLTSSLPLGKKTTLNGKEYQNVIQVPGYLTNNDTDVIYLNLRKFDSAHDQSLFPPIYCYCLIAIGMDVPVWVATSHSYTSCPQSED